MDSTAIETSRNTPSQTTAISKSNPPSIPQLMNRRVESDASYEIKRNEQIFVQGEEEAEEGLTMSSRWRQAASVARPKRRTRTLSRVSRMAVSTSRFRRNVGSSADAISAPAAASVPCRGIYEILVAGATGRAGAASRPRFIPWVRAAVCTMGRIQE
jgi:hypothetical protein